MRLSHPRSAVVFATLFVGSGCSLVTGSGDLDFSREEPGGDGDGDGDESGGSSGYGDGDGEASGGMTAAGGTGSGGEGSGGGTFTGISYDFDTDLEGWWLQPDASGWDVPPDPSIQDAKMRADMTCLEPFCEAIYFVILDPRAPAENLQLFAGFAFETGASGLYSCQFGFTCDEPVDWLWSDTFACDDIVAGLDTWEAHRDANASCSIYRFGTRLTTSSAVPSTLELDYLSLFPPE